MIVNVRLNDCRTTFQLASRGDMRRLLAATTDPDEDETRPVKAWARWNLDDPAWVPVRLTFLRRGSIAFVVAAEDESSDPAHLPAKTVADERAARFAKGGSA